MVEVKGRVGSSGLTHSRLVRRKLDIAKATRGTPTLVVACDLFWRVCNQRSPTRKERAQTMPDKRSLFRSDLKGNTGQFLNLKRAVAPDA
jgi:hypothetical protein